MPTTRAARRAAARTFTHHTPAPNDFRCPAYGNEIYSLALLPDGLRFVSASYDRTACIVYHGLAPVSR